MSFLKCKLLKVEFDKNLALWYSSSQVGHGSFWWQSVREILYIYPKGGVCLKRLRNSLSAGGCTVMSFCVLRPL